MSWFKVFSAVVVANIVSWIVISLIGWLVWAFVIGTTLDALKENIQTKPGVLNPPPSRKSTPSHNPAQSQVTIGNLPSTSAPTDETDRSNASPSAIRTNRQMCDFWTSQYQKNPSAQNDAYRKNACLRYRQSLR